MKTSIVTIKVAVPVAECARCGRTEVSEVVEARDPLRYPGGRRPEGAELEASSWSGPEGWGSVEQSKGNSHDRRTLCPDCQVLVAAAIEKALRP